MVWCNFSCNMNACAFSITNDSNTFFSRNMTYMIMTTSLLQLIVHLLRFEQIHKCLEYLVYLTLYCVSLHALHHHRLMNYLHSVLRWLCLLLQASIMPSYIMLAVCTPTPSSVNAKAPSFTSAGKSTNSLPN